MKFQEQLQEYMTKIDCTAKELSEASHLSSAVISRYKTGEREPEAENLEKLAAGFSAIAASKNIDGMDYVDILTVFQNSLNEKNIEYENFIENYNALITALDINMKELSSATNFDTSYLYRVRSGQRRPKDLDAFSDSFSRFVVTRYNDSYDKVKIATLTGCNPESIQSNQSYLTHLRSWLYHAASEKTNDYMGNFLKKLDEFDLDEYICAIHFDELKVPSMPFALPAARHYYGIEEMRKGELDFFKSAVLSKSMEPVFMCSDMPMDDMAKDMDFNKKWMFGIAMLLKKGQHLNIIHNIDRPFHELMLGLEAWIPIYMTGQVSPYYLPDISTEVYHHFTYVSGSGVLTGECISGHHDKGHYYFTNNRQEVSYYKQKASLLLSKAQPLMEIFTASEKEQFHKCMHSLSQMPGTRHNILSALPLYTISDSLLTRILMRNQISDDIRASIQALAAQEHTDMETLLQTNLVFDEIIELSEEEFQKHPMQLSISACFSETDIPYTYEEYLEHLTLTREFADKHAGYTMKLSNAHVFRNIQIQMLEGNCVMISKVKAPVIHFVIRHPKMVNALENFIPPVVE